MRTLSFSRKIMDHSKLQIELDELSARLRATLGDSEIYLFGSAAEGPFYEDSDFDVLVVASDENELRLFREKLGKAHPLVNRSVDYVWMLKSDFDRKKKIGGVAMICFELNKRL